MPLRMQLNKKCRLKGACLEGCLNGGMCFNSVCACAHGYYGPRCQFIVSASVTKNHLTRFQMRAEVYNFVSRTAYLSLVIGTLLATAGWTLFPMLQLGAATNIAAQEQLAFAPSTVVTIATKAKAKEFVTAAVITGEVKPTDEQRVNKLIL
uniref:EGF-like domain-containing protein n=1 Tax=Strigamia maritima TaxID=126957 RepID=T1IM46_STRMM